MCRIDETILVASSSVTCVRLTVGTGRTFRAQRGSSLSHLRVARNTYSAESLFQELVSFKRVGRRMKPEKGMNYEAETNGEGRPLGTRPVKSGMCLGGDKSVKGMITSRTGETLIVKGAEGTSTLVLTEDDNKR